MGAFWGMLIRVYRGVPSCQAFYWLCASQKLICVGYSYKAALASSEISLVSCSYFSHFIWYKSWFFSYFLFFSLQIFADHGHLGACWVLVMYVHHVVVGIQKMYNSLFVPFQFRFWNFMKRELHIYHIPTTTWCTYIKRPNRLPYDHDQQTNICKQKKKRN